MAVDAAAIRHLLADRLMGVLRADMAAEPGTADELAARLQEHPAFLAALDELRAAGSPSGSSSASVGGSVGGSSGGSIGGSALGRPTTSWGGDGGRPKTVVWTFDSDSGGSGSVSGSARASTPSDGSASSAGGAGSPRDPFCRDDLAVLERLAAQMADAAGPEPQRLRALAALAARPAQDALCDQHWPAVLRALGACLVAEASPAVRRAATDELCRMLAAALPGSLAFDIIAALGAACRESLRRGVPLDEMAARASLLTRALAAVSGSWEQLSEEQAEAFVGELCHLAQPSLQRAETGTAAAGPSVLALMGLVDPAGTWARGLARLGMRHALLPALLDRSILEEYLALLLPLPSFLLSHLRCRSVLLFCSCVLGPSWFVAPGLSLSHACVCSVCSSDAQERDVSGGDWRLLEVYRGWRA